MTKIWPKFFQQNIRSSETVVEAVDRLMIILDDEQKAVIAIVPEENLIDLQFDLGMAIRNDFGLHESGNKLLTSCGVVLPDDAVEAIIQALRQRLRSSPEA